MHYSCLDLNILRKESLARPSLIVGDFFFQVVALTKRATTVL